MKKIKLSTSITNRSSTSFKQYLAEIRDVSPLSVDEEYETSVLAFNGDEEAVLKLVNHIYLAFSKIIHYIDLYHKQHLLNL
jgi:hypothetical protein